MQCLESQRNADTLYNRRYQFSARTHSEATAVFDVTGIGYRAVHHFLATTSVTDPGEDVIWNSSMSRSTPGRPLPKPPLVVKPSRIASWRSGVPARSEFVYFFSSLASPTDGLLLLEIGAVVQL